MKCNCMDGNKDTKKIDKIETKSKSKNTEGESSASTTDDKKETNDCGSEEDSNDGGKEGKTSGKMGDSVKANGKSGKVIGKNYSYDELPDKYKDKIQLPRSEERRVGKESRY